MAVLTLASVVRLETVGTVVDIVKESETCMIECSSRRVNIDRCDFCNSRDTSCGRDNIDRIRTPRL